MLCMIATSNIIDRRKGFITPRIKGFQATTLTIFMYCHNNEGSSLVAISDMVRLNFASKRVPYDTEFIKKDSKECKSCVNV
ncbi:uncharacterized protein OCT59_015907 [Rhizophagus irregularis]|uniref:uncharacterized protein n=1 Tax=Rhizophagus irregularis TaxID=588596 RepID=UPI0033295C31|nr:hypothetical protein OCT59_015907 [Rhizophagus irregularis]